MWPVASHASLLALAREVRILVKIREIEIISVD